MLRLSRKLTLSVSTLLTFATTSRVAVFKCHHKPAIHSTYSLHLSPVAKSKRSCPSWVKNSIGANTLTNRSTLINTAGANVFAGERARSDSTAKKADYSGALCPTVARMSLVCRVNCLRPSNG